MKKIKNLLKGSPVAIVVVGLIVAGIVGAALVDYLSDTVQADIEVKSPMEVGISAGKESWSTTQCVNKDINDSNYDTWVDSFPECGSPDLHDWDESDWTTPLTLNIYGGETITLYAMSANLADAEINGYEEFIVTNPLGVTCADFESVKIRTDSIYGSLGYGTEHELISGGCREIKWDTVQFGPGDVSKWGAGETDVSKIVVTFKSNALGTYTVKTRVIPAE